MKLLALNLLAFGRFKDYSLDFSPGPGLQIIYGPNEAGKSTSLRALRSLLYGIPTRSTDNFLHDYDCMRVGGRLLHSDGQEATFLRRKGIKNTLLDEQGKPLPESALQRFLGGMTQEVFASLFGITHHELVQGGLEILQQQGAVGQSLFSAGLGGVSLRSVLETLEKETSELFLPKGQTQLINRAVKDYNEARTQANQLCLSGREYAEHEQKLAEAERGQARLLGRAQELRAEQERLHRLQRAFPLLAERGTLLQELRALGVVILLPVTFGRERLQLVSQRQREQERFQLQEQKARQLQEQIASMEVPHQLLQRAERVRTLHQGLGAYLQPLRDLPARQARAEGLRQEAQKILSQLRPGLSLAQAQTVRVSPQHRVQLHALGSRLVALREEVRRAAAAARQAENGLEECRQSLARLAQPPPRDALRLVIRAVQKQGNISGDLFQARQALAAEETRVEQERQRLGLCKVTPETLLSLPVPTSETIDRFEQELGGLDQELQQNQHLQKQTRDQLSDWQLQLRQLELGGSVPRPEDLVRSRVRREEGWQRIRKTWLEGSTMVPQENVPAEPHALASQYERSVRNADEISDRLRLEADRVAKHAGLLLQVERDQETLSSLEQCGRELASQRQARLNAWMALWCPVKIEALSPREMRPWRVRFLQLIQLAEQSRLTRGRVEELQLRMTDALARLSGILQEMEKDPGDHSLELQLERCVELEQGLEALERQRQALQQQLLAGERLLAEAGKSETQGGVELGQWQEQWARAVAELGLGAEATPEMVNTVLADLEKLFARLDAAEEQERQLIQLQVEAQRYAGEVQQEMALLAPELGAPGVEQAILALHERLQKAHQDEATLRQLRQRAQEAERERQEAATALQQYNARLQVMCHEAGVANVEALPACEELSARVSAARHRLAELEQALLRDSGGLALDEFARRAEEVSTDTLPSRLEEIQQQLAVLEQERSAADRAIGEERTHLRRMDGNGQAALAAEKAQSLLVQIEERSERYVRLRLAQAVLQRQIERYRAENQDPLLREASRYFSSLTLSGFSSITTEYEQGDEPVLKGVRVSGEQVGVQGMSEGTRDQLYLALRLASLERYLESHEPIPFVVDDILIHFDDERAAAALRVLGDFSSKTQVLFFTHHQRLVELAREAVAGVGVQELRGDS